MSGPQPDEPNYFVLIAPGSDSNDPNPTWIDVSTDLRSVTISRGADKHLDEDQPGEATIVLNNWEGTYDNENSQSPYFGQLVTDMRVRVLAEWDGELHERFNGYLDDIELEYPDEDATAWATFRATDAFKVLALSQLPTSAFVVEVLADSPVAFYRLDETVGEMVAIDAIGGFNLEAIGAPVFGEMGLVARDDESTAMSLDSQTEGFFRRGGVMTGGPLTIELVYQYATSAADCVLAGYINEKNAHGATLGVSVTNGKVTGFASNALGLAAPLTTGIDVRDGLVHHLALVWESDGDVIVYVDGVSRATGTVTAGAFSDLLGGMTFIGGAPLGSISETTGALGTYQFVAFYNSGLSATRIAEHALAVSTPWNFDTPSQRAHRVADAIGWPEEYRDFEEGLGQTTLQSATLNMSALEHLLKVAASEFGDLHVLKDGTIKLVARHSLINRAALASFGVAADEIHYRTVTFTSGADLVRNPVTVSRLEGAAQTASTPASYYPHHFNLEGLYHSSDELSLAAATFLVSEFKDQKRRITGVTFGPFNAERLFDWFPLLLEAELGDVYQITFQPPNGDDLVQLCVLEGTDESWSADEGIGTVGWRLSRAYAGSFWELGVIGRSELGDTTRLYF